MLPRLTAKAYSTSLILITDDWSCVYAVTMYTCSLCLMVIHGDMDWLHSEERFWVLRKMCSCKKKKKKDKKWFLHHPATHDSNIKKNYESHTISFRIFGEKLFQGYIFIELDSIIWNICSFLLDIFLCKFYSWLTLERQTIRELL